VIGLDISTVAMLDILLLRLPVRHVSAKTSARTFFLQIRRGFATTPSLHVPAPSPTSPEVKAAQAYCSNLVRKYDAPSYTLQYFIPAHILPAYTAIRAFNIEVARIPDLVSNAAVGAIRMQFWRDTINATFDQQPPAEPVAMLLSSVLSRGQKLNKSWFMKIINTRDQKLSHPGFTSISELESYSEATYATVLYLTLSALPLHSLAMDHLASHIGKASGIVAVLRGFPLLAFPPPAHQSHTSPGAVGLPTGRDAQGIITLPLDAMSSAGVREEDIFRRGPLATGLKDAAFTVATRASDHLITAREMLKNIKKLEDPGHEYEHMNDEGHDYSRYNSGVRLGTDRRIEEFEKGFSTIMGPAVSTQLWLDRLQKCDFDLFHNSMRQPEYKLPFAAWWRNKRQEF
jgi:NADH dehydrogenase [ubiquinone] 1 alpha subcomplex assembly factor 6